MANVLEETIKSSPPAKIITVDLLARIGFGDPNTRQAWADALDRVAGRYEINTKQRVAMWLAQLGHESNRLRRLEESLYYSSAVTIRRVFSADRIPEDVVNLCLKNPEMMGNTVYGGAWGTKNLGNEVVGDGYAYRGRGPIQITGKRNYRAFAQSFHLTEVDTLILDNPGLLSSNIYVAAASAGWFWNANKMNGPADRADHSEVRRLVNRARLGLDETRKLFDEVVKAMN
ncbi:glycoside hydrolase family 19 protein [Gonapodya prolifera JEL478]|uniref:Glycoside hydrolase family 19 protein n=1 Tax=Gonapodya prolifera (strain JEL478) TaxID=1344416 RepID=A0A139A6M7_GONPJ|nr:glycoside hydrolase family 19 protein [Gonapodya prolifera JEL478]|eukprot:KXS12476.1 glycoside hydrolase family 19 protein [Gonapodya prolifera JEL478]